MTKGKVGNGVVSFLAGNWFSLGSVLVFGVSIVVYVNNSIGEQRAYRELTDLRFSGVDEKIVAVIEWQKEATKTRDKMFENFADIKAALSRIEGRLQR